MKSYCRLLLFIVISFGTLNVAFTQKTGREFSIDDLRFDTIRQSGYLLGYGTSMYYVDYVDRKPVKIPGTEYYSNSFFIPASNSANVIGNFLERYLPAQGTPIRSVDSFGVKEFYIYCVNRFRCRFFRNPDLDVLNKTFKMVLPDFNGGAKYQRKKDGQIFHVFAIDATWLKFTLPRKYSYDNAGISWPVHPDEKADSITYYYLLDYYSFSPQVELNDSFLTRID
ncbi:MAG: hypothetical protein EOO43_04990 [Flavobacterium sp.]|nr:MAG: hypothetical protein EOO43_04990 [Flavobacterium sp.]